MGHKLNNNLNTMIDRDQPVDKVDLIGTAVVVAVAADDCNGSGSGGDGGGDGTVRHTIQ